MQLGSGNKDAAVKTATRGHSTLGPPFGQSQHGIDHYHLPNAPVKAGRRWGQRHPQGANFGSQRNTQFPVQDSHNGCHQPTLGPLLANVCQASPLQSGGWLQVIAAGGNPCSLTTCGAFSVCYCHMF